jgi:hypothetical protein
MPNLRITELPNAAALTGNESVPISQNGTTVQTTTGAIAAVPILNFTFLTATQQAGLANSRYLQVGSGLSLTDGGAQNPLTINLAGVLAAFVAASDGIIVKNGTTVLSRSVAVSGNGLSITNADGVAGNPTLSVTGFLLNVANLTSGAGLVGRDLAGSAQLLTITGTANQIAVTNGNGNAGNPTISLASNPVLPGVAGVVVPSGTTAERAISATNGTIRYNTTSNVFEGYSNGLWGPLVAGAGTGTVTSVNVSGGTTGLTFTGGPIISNGTITMGGSLEVGYGGTGTTSTPTNGQILIGNSAGNYTVANITAGTNIAITNTSGGITISATAGAGTVTAVNATAPLASSGGTTPTISISGAVPIANGGTGQTTASSAFNALSPIIAKGDIIVGDGVNSSNRLAVGTNGYVLTADSTTATGMKWAAAASGMVYPGAGIPNSTGSAWGTSYSTTGSGSVVLSTSPVLISPDLGTPTTISLTNATGLPLTSGVTGTLGLSNGGTGNNTTATNGQLLIGNSTGGFTLATITAGSNVTVTNGNGTITISATAGGAGVSAVTATAPLASSGGGTPDISLTGVVAVANGGTGVTTSTANYFFAAPNGSAGAPSFRAIIPADIPTLNQNTTGSAGSVTSALTVNNSGSGAASGITFNGSSAVTISYNTVGAPSATGTNASGTWNISITGNAATATTAGSATSVSNPVTFNDSGGGAASGSTFNGSSGLTVSYNTLGAPKADGTGASGTWGISVSGNAATVTNGVYTTGSYADPSWITSLATSKLSGQVSVSNGGTGLSATPTNGQLLIGNGSGFSLATITAGANIAITNTPGGIQIDASGGGGGGGAGNAYAWFVC